MVVFQATKWEVYEEDEGTLIYIHGLDQDDKSVCVKIPDMKPYVYLELDSKVKWSSGKLQLLYSYLKNTLKDQYPVKVHFVSDKKKNYYLKPAKFLWMAFDTKKCIRSLERAVRGYVTIFGVGKVKLTVHEQRASPELQLFAMRKVRPSGWISAVQTEKKSLLEEYPDTFSTANTEVLCSYKDISPAEDIDHVINPKVLSYDIECISDDSTGNTFPNAKNKRDYVICISATVARLHDDCDTWETYCLVNEAGGRECPDIEGTKILHFKNEKTLLIGWSDFINDIDPDVITGYNTLSFDDKYVSNRADVNMCWPRFSKMGRIIGQRSRMGERKWSSSAYGDQEFNYIDIPGRLHIDMYPVIFKDNGNLMSYKLDYVAEHFLGDKKIDLPAKEMIQIWHEGGSENMKKIVEYCNKDTYLPLKIMQNQNSWLGLSEMSNVMMVPVFDLVTRGQQIRVYSQVYCLCYDLGVVCTDKWTDYQATDAEKQFVGATVQNPKSGYWELVATFDFASLYPSVILAYNICFSTFVPEGVNPPEEEYHDLSWVEHSGCIHDTAIRKTKVTKVICGKHHYRFYKASVKKGIIPMLLEHLLDARARAKKEMKRLSIKLNEEADTLTPEEKKKLKINIAVMNKRQLGYKVSSNSMYGGYGSDYSYTPFYPAAASTTAMGRKSIQDAIDFANTYRDDTVIVYGDSVTADTPVILKDPQQRVVIRRVSDFTGEWVDYGEFKPSFTEPIDSSIEYHVVDDGPLAVMAARHMFNQDTRFYKQKLELDGWSAWTDIGWSKINKIIKHKTRKKIYRITTPTGTVDITEDHSLLTPDKTQVKPVDVKIGDKLLHANLPHAKKPVKYNYKTVHYDIPIEILNGDLETRQKYWGNYSTSYSLFDIKDKLIRQKAWYLGQSVGDDIPIMPGYAKGNKYNYNEIYDIQVLGTCDDYVYDLETVAGRFQAGIGEMIVKNTDSCMLHFKGIKTLKDCFKVCEDMEEEFSKIFPHPMKLELEKIYSKYFLLSKKRYVGYIVDPEGVLQSTDKKGVVIKRRDNCGYLRKIYGHLIDMVMDKNVKWRMYQYLAEMIDKLLKGDVDLEDLVITKSIKENYKAQNMPHVAVAKKMRERGKYVTSGTRIRYIFVVTDNKNDPQYIKAEDPDYYLENKDAVKIDYPYYFEKQLVNPLDEVLEVKFKVKDVLKNLCRLLKKGAVKDATTYFAPRFKVEE